MNLQVLFEPCLNLAPHSPPRSFLDVSRIICINTDIYCYYRRTGFNRQADGTAVNSPQQRVNGSPNPSPTGFSPTMQPLNQTASSSSTIGSVVENGASGTENQIVAETPKFFFQERFAKLGVKGNFMPLAAQPSNVELADWLAHQSK